MTRLTTETKDPEKNYPDQNNSDKDLKIHYIYIYNF